MLEVRIKALWMVRAAATAAAIAVTGIQPATAQTYTYAYYQTANKSPTASLTIPVKASVNTSCGFQQVINENFNVGNIDEAGWTRSTSFVPECTTPWRIAISSTNGGLLNNGAGTPVAGYLNKAPYTVSLKVKSDAGDVNASCAAADLHSSAGTNCTFKGTASMTNGLRVGRSYQLIGSSIQVAAPAYTGPGVLISGTYQDTLTVTVSPST